MVRVGDVKIGPLSLDAHGESEAILTISAGLRASLGEESLKMGQATALNAVVVQPRSGTSCHRAGELKTSSVGGLVGSEGVSVSVTRLDFGRGTAMIGG
jgi:hypothetical protein